MLRIEKHTMGYPGKPDILRDIDLELNRSDILALIGPNGSGKTTLMRGITGLLPPRSGRVSFDDRDLFSMPIRERASLISVVPQMATLPPGYTVFESVSHGRTPYLNWYGKLSEKDREAIESALRLTGLEALADKEVAAISGGEQQRVILARALAQDAPVMILDEPTNCLDLRYQIELLELVRQVSRQKGLCCLLIIHDLNLAARFADRIAILDKGSIAACGTPEAVLRPELLTEVYKTPVKVLKTDSDGIIILPGERPDKTNTAA